MNQNEQLHELALFAGAGGGILGGKLLGWKTICAVEWDAYARDVLVARQNDGCLDPFPIWDDVQTFDGRPWRGRVDVVSGGFPCQDISAAGKGAGIEGERSGMWVEMARIIGEVRPRFAFVENSPMLTSRGLGTCLGDLATLGYHARWGVVGANAAGAPHKRERIWIVAYDPRSGWPAWGPRGSHPSSERKPEQTLQDVPDTLRPERESRTGRRRVREGNQAVANAESARAGDDGKNDRKGRGEIHASDDAGCACGRDDRPENLAPLRDAAGAGLPHRITGPMGEPGAIEESERPDWWATEPDVGRVAHGVAARVDRLRCIGNGQVSRVVPIAWNLLR